MAYTSIIPNFGMMFDVYSSIFVYACGTLVSFFCNNCLLILLHSESLTGDVGENTYAVNNISLFYVIFFKMEFYFV